MNLIGKSSVYGCNEIVIELSRSPRINIKNGKTTVSKSLYSKGLDAVKPLPVES